MSWVFDHPAREQFRDQLARIARLGGSRIEIPPAAPKLDADLRGLWKDVTGRDATVSHSGPSSPFQVFCMLALDAIVADANPGSGIYRRTIHLTKPQQLFRQTQPPLSVNNSRALFCSRIER